MARRKRKYGAAHHSPSRGENSSYRTITIKVKVKRQFVDGEGGYMASACVARKVIYRSNDHKTRKCGHGNSTLSPSHAIHKAIAALNEKIK